MSDFSVNKDTSRRANSVSITTVALPVIFLVGILLAQHTLYVETYTTGEKLYRKKNYSDAYGYFSQVFTQSSDKDLRAKSLYMKALCSYKEEKYSRAAQEFEEFVRMFPDHPLVYRAAFWAGDANFNIGNYLASAQDFAVAMLENDARWQMRASKSLENILWGYLPIDYFPTLLDRVDRSLEGFIAVYWLRRLQYDGEYAQALREGQKMLQRVYDAQSKRKLEDEINNIVDYLKNNLVVAVLIPQQGDYAEYGRDVERGVRLAFSGVGKNIDLRILDTGGDPLKTAKQMDKLMQSTTPLCIIGPITSNETVAAGALAGTYKVPLITPSASRDGIAEISPYIFQMIASPVKASAYLARFSSDSMDTFAILAPDDELGHSCAMAFASVIAGKGKTLLGAEFYTRGTVDFSQHLANIKEPILQYYDENWQHFDTLDEALYECDSDSGCKVKPREEWLVHIDGFFLPAYYDDIVVILPQIPFMYIDTKVLGTNGWVIEDLLREKRLRRYLDSTLVVPDDFYICEDNSGWNSFARKYRAKYGESPSRLAALGYDAATLVIDGINKGAVTQELMRDFLSGIHNFEGAAGPVTFDENGANMQAIILTFSSGKVHKIK